jgi:hypothetical protein
MAWMSPEPLVALTVETGDLDVAGLVDGEVEGAGTAVPGWKYEQPETVSAASRMLERII